MSFLKVLITIWFLLSFLCVSAQRPKLMLPIGHTSWIYSALFSPDGKRVVTASNDRTAKIWDALTGNLLADLRGHAYSVTSAKFSSDGKKIVTASDSSTKIWDALTGNLLADLKGHRNFVSSADFSPDGKKIITASSDHTAKIWDAATGNLLVNLKGHTSIDWSQNINEILNHIDFNSAEFSLDGKKVVTALSDSTAKIWDALTGNLLAALEGHSSSVKSAKFSPDGKKVVTASSDGTVKIWDAVKGNFLFDLKGRSSINSVQFSPDGKKIATASGDSTAKIWNALTGNLLANLKGHTSQVASAEFSSDGKKIVTCSGDSIVKIWDVSTGSLLADLREHAAVTSAHFSPDGKKIVSNSGNTAKIWEVWSGNLLADLKKYIPEVMSAQFSPDGKKIVTTSDSSTKIWDVLTGNLLSDLEAHTSKVISAQFSFDGKKIVTASYDHTAKIWDALTGNLLADLRGHTSPVTSAKFSPDSKKIVTTSDSSGKIWDALTGSLLADLKGHRIFVSSADFSPDGKKIITASGDHTAKIWDALTGNLLADLQGHSFLFSAQFSSDGKKIVTCGGSTAGSGSFVKIWDDSTGAWSVRKQISNAYSAAFSPDGKMIITASLSNKTRIWDIATGNLLADFRGRISDVASAEFSPDGKMIVITSTTNEVEVWNVPVPTLLVHASAVCSIQFSPDGKKIVIRLMDNTIEIWDASSGTLLYTFFAIGSKDYLVVDALNHYDGTPGARKLLYYTCGTEVIELQQLKDKLWVPHLAERIMKGETINAPKLLDLDICDLTPLVEAVENNQDDYYEFKITPRRGRLGETVLYVNGIETKKYKPEALKKVNEGYELLVSKEELSDYFVANKENAVEIKAYTAQNDISSRGVKVIVQGVKKITTSPNLYAIIIGVSDYKGEELDLNYAAKDAADIGNAISLSSSKLLGKDHVFIYNLNTGKDHYAYPEKNSIKDIFLEIGKKATSNDILLVFFAGHGVVEGEQKQFYLLTADASNTAVNDKDVKDVGISATELMEWMKPNNIKAQKRIMILDACNTGQAINQIISIGKDQGYLAARNDDKAAEIKQIDKLNEKAGLYILAASASNQSAYELGRYNQGLLTYSLLKVMKEHPEVLEENKFLNVSGWFNAATNIVTDLIRENNLRQEPQLITTTNFNIGIVDAEVMAGIVLPNEKPLFAPSNFQNNDAVVMDDDLGLTNYVNKNLSAVASRSGESKITFINATGSPEAWLLVGRYDVKGDNVIVRVNMKQNNEVKNKFELKGKKTNLQELAEQIVNKATEWIEKLR